MSNARPSAPTGPPSDAPSHPRAVHPHAVHPNPVGPPNKHQLAVMMIWTAVFPTLTVLNLTLGPWLATLGPVLRTFILATIAVPIVIYGLMPQLHRIRGHILTRRAA